MAGRAHWSNRLAFVFAAAGSAIGLGNIWKFPYITGVNGGGAFVLIYLACIAAVGVPILIAEMYIGQKGQANTVTSFENTHKTGSPWQIAGWMGLLAALLILSFYSVVGGWILDFEYRSLLSEFSGMSTEQIQGTLGSLFSSPVRMLLWHFVFMAMVIGIVIAGVKDGLERWNKILMPALFGIIIILLIRVVAMDGFSKAIAFLFSFDASKLTARGVLEALGHSFFTLSLGMGAILTYGSYLSEKESLPRVAVLVAFLDTFIALLAGVIIFTIVFSFNLEPGAGPGLIFSTLPSLFVQMPGGNLLSIAFFLLVTFAALTSAVSILEVPVAYFSEKKGWGRKKTTTLIGAIIFLLGIPCALSFNVMGEFKIIGLNVFDLFDKFSSNILLPVGGMIIALFFGWVLGEKAVNSALDGYPPIAKTLFIWSVRVLAPIGVLVMIINTFSS
ncbi:MAG: sodium-dependent transporter [Bdellovibrionales bacterium]|nr:sodium-dependent transporter [Bdellovibrionales bacterium]